MLSWVMNVLKLGISVSGSSKIECPHVLWIISTGGYQCLSVITCNGHHEVWNIFAGVVKDRMSPWAMGLLY